MKRERETERERERDRERREREASRMSDERRCRKTCAKRGGGRIAT
jgi:hypothetical protein